MSITRQEIGKGPPSIALAIMALNLAGRRKWAIEYPFAEGAAPLQRNSGGTLSEEYYAIIDRISAGEAP